MKAYRTYQTVEESQQIILRDLPFRPGERVEVLLISEERNDNDLGRELQALLKETQGLPQLHTLTDEEIEAEVLAYRQKQ